MKNVYKFWKSPFFYGMLIIGGFVFKPIGIFEFVGTLSGCVVGHWIFYPQIVGLMEKDSNNVVYENNGKSIKP